MRNISLRTGLAFTGFLAVFVLLGTQALAVPTGLDVVLFTGLGSGSTLLDDLARAVLGDKTGQGLAALGQEFQQQSLVAPLRQQVFPWDQESQAGAFVQSLIPTDELVVIGHSFGADSALEFAKNTVPTRSIDLLVAVDDACLSCPGGFTKPPNVQHEIEIYHDPNSSDSSVFVTPFLKRLANPDQSVDVTTLFAEPEHQDCLADVGGVVSHTNISNSACVHRMIMGAAFSLFATGSVPDVTTFLEQAPATTVPEPSTWILLASGFAVLACARRKKAGFLFSKGL